MANFQKSQTKEKQKKSNLVIMKGRPNFMNVNGIPHPLDGSIKVPNLHDTRDSIGMMNSVCQYYVVLKFPKETGLSCCNAGKVILQPFPNPMPELHQLWQ